MKINVLGFFLLIIIVAGCETKEISDEPVDFDYGHIENNKYHNSYFDVEITIPSGWIVQTKEQMEDVRKVGAELVSSGDSNMKAIVKASSINTANLLMVFQYERGTAVEFNPSISIMAENVVKYPGIKTGSDYLFQSRKILSNTQIKYDHIDNEFEKEIINGAEFYKMNASINFAGIDVKQVYYSKIVNSFSFIVIISYVDEQQKDELLKSINSMKFGD